MSRETTQCTWSGLCGRESHAFAAGGKRGRVGEVERERAGGRVRDRKGESRRERRWKGERPGRVWIKNQILQDDKCSVMFQCRYK